MGGMVAQYMGGMVAQYGRHGGSEWEAWWVTMGGMEAQW
jgi:hypothetical protein